jgi:ABC-type uncharacterized transport system YnjBCD permease subunit
MPVKTINKTIAKVITLISIVIALYPWVIWIIVFNQPGRDLPGEKGNIFLRYFPSFMKNMPTIFYTMAIGAIIAIIFSVRWRNRETGSRKVIPLIILILSVLILLLTLFSMM